MADAIFLLVVRFVEPRHIAAGYAGSDHAVRTECKGTQKFEGGR